MAESTAAATATASPPMDTTTKVMIGVGVVAVGAVIYYTMGSSGDSKKGNILSNAVKVVTDTFKMTSDATVGGKEAAEDSIDKFKRGDIAGGIAAGATSFLDALPISDFAKVLNDKTRTENRVFHGIEGALRIVSAVPFGIIGWLLPGARMEPKHELAEQCEYFVVRPDNSFAKYGYKELLEYAELKKQFPDNWPKGPVGMGKVMALCTAEDSVYDAWAHKIHRTKNPKDYYTWPSGNVPINPAFVKDQDAWLQKVGAQRFQRVEESKFSESYWKRALNL